MVLFDTLIILTLAISSTVIFVADNISDLERNAKALEIYLQDKKDYKDNCPNIDWKQPSLDIYKKNLESQLPEGCIK
jgi:hypothetical protein